MSNNFEYQSNCMINDNIKSELNEEEDTEDMSEDIEILENDKGNNDEEMTVEDRTQLMAKRKDNRIETSGQSLADLGQTIVRRVCASLNCQQFCDPIDSYCPTCLTKFKQFSDNQFLVKSQAVANPQRQVLIAIFKCPVNGCATLCLDQMGLKKHLEIEHKSLIVVNTPSITEPKKKSSQTKSKVEVLAKSGDTSKSKIVLLDKSKKKLAIKRVSVGSGHTAKGSALGPTVGSTVGPTVGPKVASMVKCIIVGCNTKSKNQSGLKRHLERVHRLMYIQNSSSRRISVGTRRDAPIRTAHTIHANHTPANPSTPSPLTDINARPVSDEFKTSIGRGCLMEKQTKEVIINLIEYFTTLLPNETRETILDTIKMATKIGKSSIFKTLKEFKETGNLKAPVKTKGGTVKSYKCNDEDRDILSRVIYKLRDENRLRGYKSVCDEIRTSKEYNPTFKKMGYTAYGDLFKRYGFRITETKIVDMKPSDLERERIACQRSKESNNGKYACDWPGCHKKFVKRAHLIVHLRTHTKVKPFVCRFPKCDYRCAVSGNFNKHLKCHNKTVFPDDDNEEFI